MKRLLGYIKEVRAEFHQITWPKRETLIQLTVVVISVSVIISAILGGLDLLFTTSFGFLTNLNSQPQPQVEIETSQESSPAALPTTLPTLSPKPTN